MEPNENQPAPSSTPTPDAAGGVTPNPTSTPPIATPSQPGASDSASVVKNQDQAGGGKDKKKMAVVGLLVVIILMILAVVGYYAYGAMSSGGTDEVETTITQPPTPTLEPTAMPSPIENEDDLNGVIDEIDSATDEAAMEKEVQGLQSDSNF